MPKVRLGVALLLPEPVATEIDGLRRALGDGALGRMPPHVTLVPPVNVREDNLPDAFAVLRRAAAAARPLRLTLGPPDTFHPVNPVVYLRVGGDLEQLHALRDRVFADPLARPLSWPFVPHVTLADDIDPDRIPPALYALGDYRSECLLHRVHILQEGEGRTWRPLADALFEAPAVTGRGGEPVELTTSEHPEPGSEHGRVPVAITARRYGLPVGTAVGWADTGTGIAHLQRLHVEPEARDQGVGTRLLAAFESWAADRDCTSLHAQVSVETRAETFLRGRGWVEEIRGASVRLCRDLRDFA